MLECTWNDDEAEIALRRMLLKEKMEQELLTRNPAWRKKIRETAASRPPVKVMSAGAGDRDTL